MIGFHIGVGVYASHPSESDTEFAAQLAKIGSIVQASIYILIGTGCPKSNTHYGEIHDLLSVYIFPVFWLV